MFDSSKAKVRAVLAAVAVLGTVGGNAAFGQGVDLAAAPANAKNVAVVNAILNRWEPVAIAAGAHPSYWREQLTTALGLMPRQSLTKLTKVPIGDASTADRDYANFAKALKGGQMSAYSKLLENQKGSAKALGSPTDNQVFIPIVPCRIVDTRGSGQIAAGATKTYYAYNQSTSWSWSTQGGASGLANSVCPGTTLNSAGGSLGNVSPSSAVATVTVVNPTAAGNWLVWGGNGPAPTTSVLNWAAGQVLANTTVIPMGTRTGGNLDFAIRYNGPSGGADLLVDVVGYFVESSATALECTVVDNFGNGTNNFLPGTNLTIAPSACPAGHTRTATQCFVGLGVLPNVFLLEVDETGCYWHNDTAQTLNQQDYDTETLCCRVPGQ